LNDPLNPQCLPQHPTTPKNNHPPHRKRHDAHR
jgi:hypothetical protein